MTDHYDVIVIGSGAGGGTLTHALAPTGKRVLLLERGGFMPREVENWDSKAVWLDKRYANAGQVDRRGDRQEVHAEAALLRRRQHQGLRRHPVPVPRAGLRRDPARRRRLAGLADRLRRPGALVHPGRAALPGPRRARRRPDRTTHRRGLPVPGDQPRAADRPAVRGPAGRRPAPVPAAQRNPARRGRALAVRLHPVRDLRRLRLPHQRQGRCRRSSRVEPGAALPERHAADRRPGHPAGDRRQRAGP